MKRIACYGSLKKGFHNFERMGKQTLVGETIIHGAMFMFSSYPHFYDCFGKKYSYVAEIYEVDEATYEKIADMELGSGYHIKTIMVDDQEVTLFVANPKEVSALPEMTPYFIREYTLEVVREKYDPNYGSNDTTESMIASRM